MENVEDSEEGADKFSIDVNAIESIQKEDQDIELQSLGLSVFDQSVYEKGIIAQVGKALTGDSEHFLKDVENDDSDKEEGQIDEVKEEKEKDEGSTQVNNKNKKIHHEDVISNIEEYLKKQIQLQETKKLQGKSRSSNSKAASPFKVKKNDIIEYSKPKTDATKIKNKQKSKYLGPSPKKKKKEKLGTRKGQCRRDSEPSVQPGEAQSFYLDSDNSEDLAFQSDSEFSACPRELEINSEPIKCSSARTWKSLKKEDTSGSEYIPSDSDSSFELKSKQKKQPKSKTPKKKRKNYLFFERPDTDDSDWDSSDDLPKNRGTKELDDGDSDLYCRRIKEYEQSKSPVGLEKVDGDFVLPKDVWDKLYDYQKEAVKWFWHLNQQLTGGILGDEMGLGKTIQIVAYLAGLHRSSLKDDCTSYEGLGPTLIVCPTTVMHQWVREFHKWYPPIRVAILHDSGTYKGKDRTKLIEMVHRKPPYGIIITSYTGLVQYRDAILPKEWHYVILDEGHKIRNSKAKVTETAKMLETPNRLILSGSPLQNNLQELWCLFDFVCPGKLGMSQVFMETFAVPIMQGGYANASKTQVLTAHKCATILKDTITPYLLRRMKEDVGAHINLPEKKEQVLFCRLTDEQRELYKEYIGRVDIQEMFRGRAKLFVALINMRKICNHPDLYSGGPNRNFRISSGDEPPNEQHFGYWKRAGKMIVIEALLKIWNQQGHRVLLFTQSKKMLLVMEDFVRRQKYKYLKMDGQTSVSARQPLIDKFNKDSSYFLMVLTTKVGGLGVNLTGANRVVIYDPDWNPATDTQARERAWRIGQQKDVTIYRLITAGTIEEKIYHRQIFKQFLSNKILKDPKQRRFFKSNDLLELFTLSETVKHGTTETAAIFAGTGSEVNISKKSDIKSTIDAPKEKIVFSESKIEQMKKLAQLLSKKIGSSSIANENKYSANNIPTTDPSTEDTVYGPDGSINIKTARQIVESRSGQGSEVNISESVNASISVPPTNENSVSTNLLPPEDRAKKKKKKRSREIFAKYEGQEVPHLVKKRKYKKDDNESRETYMSQDDYVLKKLFTKGIDSALQHDTIMGGGPSDYAIVEAEAERVAQSALKALKESQRQAPVISLLNRKRKNGGNDLLDIIKKRNMNIESSSSYSEQTLLSGIISFLQSQGGTSTTDKLIGEFRYKVGEGKTPLFKALLEKIATFFRGPDKIGYWTIKDEYNSPSTSAHV